MYLSLKMVLNGCIILYMCIEVYLISTRHMSHHYFSCVLSCAIEKNQKKGAVNFSIESLCLFRSSIEKWNTNRQLTVFGTNSSCLCLCLFSYRNYKKERRIRGKKPLVKWKSAISKGYQKHLRRADSMYFLEGLMVRSSVTRGRSSLSGLIYEGRESRAVLKHSQSRVQKQLVSGIIGRS